MANRFDQTYLQQQKQSKEVPADARKQAEERGERKPAAPSKAARLGQRIRNLFGGNFIREIDFRKNFPYILMVFVMVIVLIYINLLTLSNQKKLEELDRERIKLNDKYIQIMDRREMLYVDENQRQALLQVYKDKGFVDDSSIVYVLKTEEKEGRR